MFREAPTTLRCPSCGYSLAGIAVGTCPECGAAITDRHGVASDALHALTDRRRAILKRAAVLHGVLLLLVSAVVGVAQQSGQMGVMFLSAGVVLIVLTATLGLLPTLVVAPWMREPVALLWIRHLWWVHLVWMVAPVVVVLLVFLQLGAAATSRGRTLTVDELATPLIIVTPPWATLLLTSVLVWWGQWGDTAKVMGVRMRVRVMTALAAIISAALSGAFAATYGFVALQGVIRWLSSAFD